MTARRLATFVALVVALGALWSWTRSDPAAPPAPEPRDPPAPPRAALVDPPRAPGPSPQAPALPDAKDLELDAALEAIRELEAELYGVPLEWDPATPEAWRPAAVAETIDRVLETCDIGARLLGVACEEPPCLVSLDVTGLPDASRQVVACPAWFEPWGGWVGQETRVVHCDDGSSRHLLVITPGTQPTVVDEVGFPVVEPPWTDPDYVANAGKRFRARVENIAPSVCR